MNPKVKLTPERETEILAYIRAGAYPHVAAAAAGVPETTWNTWKERSTRRGQYQAFFTKIKQASAQARVMAEIDARKEDVRFWLKNGPGKEQPDNPGWAAMVRPLLTGTNQTINLFSSRDFLAFMATLRAVLAPYPEALQALSIALDKPQEPEITFLRQPPQPENNNGPS
jgi:hypothetical protein